MILNLHPIRVHDLTPLRYFPHSINSLTTSRSPFMNLCRPVPLEFIVSSPQTHYCIHLTLTCRISIFTDMPPKPLLSPHSVRRAVTLVDYNISTLACMKAACFLLYIEPIRPRSFLEDFLLASQLCVLPLLPVRLGILTGNWHFRTLIEPCAAPCCRTNLRQDVFVLTRDPCHGTVILRF